MINKEFISREHAGKLLADKLKDLPFLNDSFVVAIPRGGVVVGKIIAQTLNLPLKVVVVKKLGAPGKEELAIGAVAPGNEAVLDKRLIGYLNIEEEYLEKEKTRKLQEIALRLKLYSRSADLNDIRQKTVIIVDDGIATGSTVEAAVKYLRKRFKKIIIATPVAAYEIVDKFKNRVDRIVVLFTPKSFRAVGEFYQDFRQVTDEEVLKLLQHD